MNMKHTPGPYRAHRGTGKHRTAIFIKNQKLNIFIGKVYGHENQPVEANAQLFIAAPEILTERNKLKDTCAFLRTMQTELETVNAELLEALKETDLLATAAILRTPTGPERNKLTEINILRLVAIAKATN